MDHVPRRIVLARVDELNDGRKLIIEVMTYLRQFFAPLLHIAVACLLKLHHTLCLPQFGFYGRSFVVGEDIVQYRHPYDSGVTARRGIEW
jgi:hypothetical protein